MRNEGAQYYSSIVVSKVVSVMERKIAEAEHILFADPNSQAPH